MADIYVNSNGEYTTVGSRKGGPPQQAKGSTVDASAEAKVAAATPEQLRLASETRRAEIVAGLGS